MKARRPCLMQRNLLIVRGALNFAFDKGGLAAARR